MPSPYALESNSVSLSNHWAPPFASGSAKPSATKVLASMSNSRRAAASLPPRERRKIARGFSFWVRVAKFFERRFSPDAAGIIRILPEISEHAAAPRDIRDIVRPVVNRRQDIAIPRKSRTSEFLYCQRVLPLDEIKRPFALDLFQPQIRIIIGCGDGRPVIDGHGLTPKALFPAEYQHSK